MSSISSVAGGCVVEAPKRGRSVTVAVPASLVADVPHLREKTAKIGMVGRAAAIFRVERIVVYRDLKGDQSREARLVETVLNYMATPQYLRRRLFGLMPELRYVGVLPPLRTPNHPLAKHSGELRVGEVREGVVVGVEGGRSLVEVGVERPVVVAGLLPVGGRVNVRVVGVGGRLEGVPVGRE
ncbi:MAG: putative RNA uridine N3 methyltransferase, partial [Candidatus Bathyarchaeia archaeon]